MLFLLFTITLSDKQLFEEFKRDHGIKYNSLEEEQIRYEIFKENLMKINFLNSFNSATFGITEFSDMTKEEFKDQYLHKEPIPYTTNRITLLTEDDPPKEWDWRKNNGVTDVRNQGQCGSCWAFSGIEAIESAYMIGGNTKTKISVQEIVDCDTIAGVQGCNGGWPFSVYEYVMKYGIASEADYPYEAVDDKCRRDSTKRMSLTISSYKNLSKDENALIGVVYSNGPVSFAMDATILQFYFGGIIDYEPCGKTLDHAMEVAGYGTGKHFGKEVDYWLMRNSWGGSWGESGYFRIIRNKNKCGIAEALTIPFLK